METVQTRPGYFAAKDIKETAVDGFSAFLGNTGNKQIQQDTLNPHIFTVQEKNKKSYWFLNVITSQYHLLEEYSVEIDGDNQSQEKAPYKITEAGRQNLVYPRPGAEAIAIRRRLYVESRTGTSKKIADANLLLSLLYSMQNHQEILKRINIGFIKSSKKDQNGWKMVIPAVEGGTLTQLFGVDFRGYSHGSYNRCYGHMNSQNAEIIETAKKNCLEDLDNQTPLAADLKKHYDEFCQHAKINGHLIQHIDLTPYNVMYNNKERCLTLIDQDAWNVVGEGGKFWDQDEESIFQLIEMHH